MVSKTMNPQSFAGHAPAEINISAVGRSAGERQSMVAFGNLAMQVVATASLVRTAFSTTPTISQFPQIFAKQYNEDSQRRQRRGRSHIALPMKSFRASRRRHPRHRRNKNLLREDRRRRQRNLGDGL